MSHQYFLYTLLLAYGILTVNGDELVNKDSPYKEDPRDKGHAFYALRSCHHSMHEDSGEFFAPDFLCSSPPLWCNWTIHVKSGKHVQVLLEDFTPADTCHLKNDQIHLDEYPAAGRHRILEGCWDRIEYTSRSSTLHVVQLIGGDPRPPHRGFYGRYRAFEPPSVDGHRNEVEEKGSLHDQYEEQVATTLLPTSDTTLAQYNQLEEGLQDNEAPKYEQKNITYTTDDFGEDSPRGHNNEEIANDLNGHETLDMKRSAPARVGHDREPSPPDLSTTAPALTGMWSARTLTDPSDKQPVDRLPVPDHSWVTERVADNGQLWGVAEFARTQDSANASRMVHLPGDCLFEVAVEVYMNMREVRNWEHAVNSLQKSVEDMVIEELVFALQLKAMSTDRIKRLHSSVLLITWLQFADASHCLQVYELLNIALQQLLRKVVELSGSKQSNSTSVTSVSAEDMNECRTKLALCDAHADCVNHFGSYECRCHSGFKDVSRLGTSGLMCAGPTGSGLSVSPVMLQGLYILCFLLGFFFVILLGIVAVLHQRHRRGVFLVPCGSDANNCSAAHDGGVPPPPPVRRPQNGWDDGKAGCPSVGLPLLRFSSLLPPDGGMQTEAEQGGKQVL